MDPSISCLRDFKSPSCATSSQSSLVTPSRRKESTPSCLENTPQVHNISIESTVKVKSSSPNSQRPLKRRLLSAFDKSADHFEGLPKKRRLSRRSCDSSRSASKSPQRSPASTSSCLSDNEPTQQEQVERRNTTNRSTEVVLGGKKLTERQQLAMLLEMTAKDNPVPVEEDEECSVPRGSAPAPRQSRPIDDSVARRIPARLDKRNERGETPLHVAAIRGDAALVAALIGRGADVMIKDHAGWTPLHDACSHGHVDVVVELLDGGTPVNASGFCRDRPMHDAASNGHINVVQVLLKYGGDPKLSNTKGETPLDYALSRGHTEVVKLLEASSSTCKGFVDATVPLGVQRPSNESSISSRTEAHDLCEPGSPANSSFDSTGVCHDESISSPMPTFNDCVPSSEDSDGGSETPVGSPLPVSVASKPCLAAEVVMPPLPMSPFSDTQSPVKRGITASCLPPSVPLTPKSFLPSHRFRTPRSAITSRDSGICVNSSTSSYSCSPARTDLDDGCISACSTPRHCIPPSALPRLSPKKSPEPAPTPKAFSRARFDTSALVSFQQKLQSASKTCAATEAPIPQSHSESSSQIVDSPFLMPEVWDKRAKEANAKAQSSLSPPPPDMPAELAKLRHDMHVQRMSLQERFRLEKLRVLNVFKNNTQRIRLRCSPSYVPPLNHCQIEMARQTDGQILDGRGWFGESSDSKRLSADEQIDENEKKKKDAVADMTNMHSIEWDALLGLQSLKWSSMCSRLGMAGPVPMNLATTPAAVAVSE